MTVELIGYRYSVYLRIVRVVLAEKGVAFAHVEVDPFAGPPDWYLALHPFGRVPTLRHGDFVLYETSAIARYVDAAFAGVPASRGRLPRGWMRRRGFWRRWRGWRGMAGWWGSG